MTEHDPTTPEPTTPPPPPPPADAQTDAPTVEAAAPATDSTDGTGGRSRRGLAIAGIAAVVVLALAGGAFAVMKKLDGGGAQPHDVLPASLIAYARVDVDPSAGQKVALFKLIRKFPEAANDLGIKSAKQDMRKMLFEEALSSADCDLSYDKDVEPWLGSRLGVGLDDEQTPLVAIQVKDEGKAEKGIKELFECGDEKSAIAFLDGYAIVAEDQKSADAAVKAAEKSSLGDKKQFAADFDDLGEQGVASAWVDTKAIVDAFPDLKDEIAKSSPQQVKELEQAGTAALTLRTAGSTIELAALSGLTDSIKDMTPVKLGNLPEDTVAALSIGGLGDQVAQQYDTFLKQFSQDLGTSLDEDALTEDMTPEEKAAFEKYLEDDPIESNGPEDFIKGFEESTGLKMPEDLQTLLGDGLTITVGSKNLEKVPSLSGPEDVAGLDVALQMTTDPAKAIDLAERLARLAGQVGIELSTTRTDTGAVIATNKGAADAFNGSGKLSSSSTYKDVMPYGDNTLYGAYVDVSTILDKLLEADPPKSVREDIEDARSLKAFGASYGKKDDHTVFSLRVAFAK